MRHAVRAPIPAAVAGLRRALYPHAAAVANDWQGLLGEAETYPPEWEAFRDRCRQAGQTRSTPILLRYGPGGFNALHRDLRGAVFFSVQLAVVLSPRREQAPEGFAGGEFLFCDVPERVKSRRGPRTSQMPSSGWSQFFSRNPSRARCSAQACRS